jgi:RNase H-fold protein (predicted Holliday junction resolvase)
MTDKPTYAIHPAMPMPNLKENRDKLIYKDVKHLLEEHETIDSAAARLVLKNVYKTKNGYKSLSKLTIIRIFRAESKKF